jgi:hypothetical protein
MFVRGDRTNQGIRSFARDDIFQKYWNNRTWPRGEKKDLDAYHLRHISIMIGNLD